MDRQVIIKDGQAYMQTEDGRLLLVGPVKEGEPTATAEEFSRNVSGMIPPMEDPALGDVLEGMDPPKNDPLKDLDFGRGQGPGKTQITNMMGGYAKRQQAEGGPSEFAGMLSGEERPPEPTLTDRIKDIADRATKPFSDWAGSDKKASAWPPMPKQPTKKVDEEA